MNCTICKKQIYLSPAATERSAKDVTGKSSTYYEQLFTEHADCIIAKRNASLPIRRLNDMQTMFQNLELLRLRQLVAKTFGGLACTAKTAEYVNNQTEAALRELL